MRSNYHIIKEREDGAIGIENIFIPELSARELYERISQPGVLAVYMSNPMASPDEDRERIGRAILGLQKLADSK